MNRFILTSIIMGLFALAWPDISVAAKPKPGSGKQSASQQRPDTSRRVIRENYANKKQSKSHQKVEKAKLEMTHRHTDVKNMELQVSHAKSLEAKAKLAILTLVDLEFSRHHDLRLKHSPSCSSVVEAHCARSRSVGCLSAPSGSAH